MNQKSEGRVHPTTQQEKEVVAQFHADKDVDYSMSGRARC